jgi:hypothetical protein
MYPFINMQGVKMVPVGNESNEKGEPENNEQYQVIRLQDFTNSYQIYVPSWSYIKREE